MSTQSLGEEVEAEDKDEDDEDEALRLSSSSLPSSYCAAGIIPYNKNGFWLGFEEKGWTDFGGKIEKGDGNAWETALRECKEEAGIDLGNIHLTRSPIYHSGSKSVIFWVETDAIPFQGLNTHMTEFRQFKAFPKSLHPRLKFDKGGLLKKEIQEIGF